ncbi:hypothetical protein [uncultured Megasphaera sp.]|uniref:defense against restriction DarA-related protein n=1 Tax=uncultured Megasphaera sp. TaxID=165188 RepID=UPI00265CA048|nr:hypothetical protein [uncultured Megasphaera sp.]
MKYKYKCKYRPPTPGAVPRGVVEVDDNETSDSWGTVIYNRPLNERELSAYGLELKSMEDERG